MEVIEENSEEIAGLMAGLKNERKYAVSPAVKAQMDDLFAAGSADDARVAETISRVYGERGYLLDTHTAVAVAVYEDYRNATGDTTPTVIASTANPYKFTPSILAALGGAQADKPHEQMQELQDKTGWNIPEPLGSLHVKDVRFTDVCGNDTVSMQQTVYRMLGLV